MTGQERQAGIETVGPITFLWTMGAGGLILAQCVGIRDVPVGAILGSRFGRSGPLTDQRSGDRADLGLRSCRPSAGIRGALLILPIPTNRIGAFMQSDNGELRSLVSA